jgi:hypothetical protein
MAANPKPRPDFLESASSGDGCAREIDRNAPAGSATSLGAKSDCNGRPSTDDSVVEAMDEQGPLKNAKEEEERRSER